jgi:hypothetical protein
LAKSLINNYKSFWAFASSHLGKPFTKINLEKSRSNFGAYANERGSSTSAEFALIAFFKYLANSGFS